MKKKRPNQIIKLEKHLYKLPYAGMSPILRKVLIVIAVSFFLTFIKTLLFPFDLGTTTIKGSRMEQNTVIGIFCLIASTIGLPTFFKGGILFDLKKKAFQDYSGFLGKTRTEWIPFEMVAYLSIVPVQGKDAAPNHMIHEKAKLFAVYERGHEELYCEYYEDVKAIADWLYVVFKVELYDKVQPESK